MEECGNKILVVLTIKTATKINPQLSCQKNRDALGRGTALEDRYELPLVMLGIQLVADDMALVANAADARVGFRLIGGSADDQDVIGRSDGFLHELWQPVAEAKVVLINNRFDTVGKKAIGKSLDPSTMFLALPSI